MSQVVVLSVLVGTRAGWCIGSWIIVYCKVLCWVCRALCWCSDSFIKTIQCCCLGHHTNWYSVRLLRVGVRFSHEIIFINTKYSSVLYTICHISMPHFHATFPCHISMPHFHATFPCHISMHHSVAPFAKPGPTWGVKILVTVWRITTSQLPCRSQCPASQSLSVSVVTYRYLVKITL